MALQWKQYSGKWNLQTQGQAAGARTWPAPSFGGGELWAWGRGNVGQLGLSNITAYSSPKQVGSLTDWSSVSGANEVSAAVKTDGTLWTWGSGYSGKLGHGNTTNYSSPKQVGALTDWASVSMQSSQALAVKTDGTLWA